MKNSIQRAKGGKQPSQIEAGTALASILFHRPRPHTLLFAQVSSHELSFRVNVTVPESGNYSLAARPSSSAAVLAPGAIIGAVPGGVDDDDGNGNGRRRRLDSGTSPSSSSSSSSDTGVDSDMVKVDWEVDLTRPETRVVSRPSPVTTTGVAAFQFACSLAGEEPSHGCFYQYQMMVVNSETDWDRLEWLPTVRRRKGGGGET